MARATAYINTAADGEVLFRSHADFSVLTLVPGGAWAGLEYFMNGSWQTANIPSDAMLLGVGTTLRAIRSSAQLFRHRVLAKARGRISLTFFADVQPNVLLPNGERAGERLDRIIRKTRVP